MDNNMPHSFTVWNADLNSLYDEQPRPAVVVESGLTEEAAKALLAEVQDHQTAAWIEPFEQRAGA